MDQPLIDGVTYVRDANHSFAHRLWWDYRGLRKWLKRRNIVPDIVISLQNTGVLLPCRQIIYYHQPLPFYGKNWSFLKSKERMLALYKYVYPCFVRWTLRRDTQVVVQLPFIKRGFVRCFGIDERRVHVMFPDVESVAIDQIPPYPFEEGLLHFIYPASCYPYKEHMTLVRAMVELRRRDLPLSARIRIHFTLQAEDNPSLHQAIIQNDLTGLFIFEGVLPHEQLLTCYKSAAGLLFPSTIETLGLPLLEAAAFGLPIVASDLEYAREVLGTYEGVRFVGQYDYAAWADAIAQICSRRERYTPLEMKTSSWGCFFELINKDNRI